MKLRYISKGQVPDRIEELDVEKFLSKSFVDTRGVNINKTSPLARTATIMDKDACTIGTLIFIPCIGEDTLNLLEGGSNE